LSSDSQIAVPVEAAAPAPSAWALLTSMRLDLLFLRFGGASLATGGTDQLLFALALRLGASIATGIVIARLLSSVVNLYLNRRYVFRSKAGLAGTLVRYYACMAWNGAATYTLVLLARDRLHAPVIPAKVTVEILLFGVSFLLGRYVIFRQPNETR
jgi:putative flippase GtrA